MSRQESVVNLGIVLAGGESRRMGLDKPSLAFGSETMLARVARIVGEAVDQVVVIAQIGQNLPPLDRRIPVLRDRAPNRGPLEGLAIGLRSATERGAQRAFLCGADMPLVRPAAIRKLLALALGHEAAIPTSRSGPEPLFAVYSVTLLDEIERLLVAGPAGPSQLLARPGVRRVELREIDDGLSMSDLFTSVNTKDNYERALFRGGIPRWL